MTDLRDIFTEALLNIPLGIWVGNAITTGTWLWNLLGNSHNQLASLASIAGFLVAFFSLIKSCKNSKIKSKFKRKED